MKTTGGWGEVSLVSAEGAGTGVSLGGVRPRPTLWTDPWGDPVFSGPKTDPSEVDRSADTFSDKDREKIRVKARPTEEEREAAPRVSSSSALTFEDELVIAIVEERWYG